MNKNYWIVFLIHENNFYLCSLKYVTGPLIKSPNFAFACASSLVSKIPIISNVSFNDNVILVLNTIHNSLDLK